MTTTYFYDGQIRRYLLQIIRLLSNFAIRYSDGTLVQVPVMYADPDRQSSHILAQNSENIVQSSPRISVYFSDISLDMNRISDSSFISKVHIRERSWNPSGGDFGEGAYENFQGDSFTVERLMPTPYRLTVKVDIWTANTDQKLQLLEQMLMLFNPSLEIQTSDNFLDWTSLSVVDLESVVYSSKTIPAGTTDAIDVATLTLGTPIYISPPAKVKKLGIVTSIISNIFSQTGQPYGNYAQGLGTDPQSSDTSPSNFLGKLVETSANYDIEISSVTISGEIKGTAKLLGFEGKYPRWENIITRSGRPYTPGLSRICLTQRSGNVIVGYFNIDELSDVEMSIDWDVDTYPSNTAIPSNFRSSLTTFDAIIDPKKTGPRDPKLPQLVAGSRYLIVDSIGGGVRYEFIADSKIQKINTNILYSKVNDHKIFVNGVEVLSGNLRIPGNVETGNYYITLDTPVDAGSIINYEIYVNEDGPDAWKNSDGTDFIAEENDIIEWDGSSWKVVFDAGSHSDQILYLTNIFTGTQYLWNGVGWAKSFEGVYRQGEWRLEL